MKENKLDQNRIEEHLKNQELDLEVIWSEPMICLEAGMSSAEMKHTDIGESHSQLYFTKISQRPDLRPADMLQDHRTLYRRSDRDLTELNWFLQKKNSHSLKTGNRSCWESLSSSFLFNESCSWFCWSDFSEPSRTDHLWKQTES